MAIPVNGRTEPFVINTSRGPLEVDPQVLLAAANPPTREELGAPYRACLELPNSGDFSDALDVLRVLKLLSQDVHRAMLPSLKGTRVLRLLEAGDPTGARSVLRAEFSSMLGWESCAAPAMPPNMGGSPSAEAVSAEDLEVLIKKAVQSKDRSMFLGGLNAHPCPVTRGFFLLSNIRRLEAFANRSESTPRERNGNTLRGAILQYRLLRLVRELDGLALGSREWVALASMRLLYLHAFYGGSKLSASFREQVDRQGELGSLLEEFARSGSTDMLRLRALFSEEFEQYLKGPGGGSKDRYNSPVSLYLLRKAVEAMGLQSRMDVPVSLLEGYIPAPAESDTLSTLIECFDSGRLDRKRLMRRLIAADGISFPSLFSKEIAGALSFPESVYLCLKDTRYWDLFPNSLRAGAVSRYPRYFEEIQGDLPGGSALRRFIDGNLLAREGTRLHLVVSAVRAWYSLLEDSSGSVYQVESTVALGGGVPRLFRWWLESKVLPSGMVASFIDEGSLSITGTPGNIAAVRGLLETWGSTFSSWRVSRRFDHREAPLLRTEEASAFLCAHSGMLSHFLGLPASAIRGVFSFADSARPAFLLDASPRGRVDLVCSKHVCWGTEGSAMLAFRLVETLLVTGSSGGEYVFPTTILRATMLSEQDCARVLAGEARASAWTGPVVDVEEERAREVWGMTLQEARALLSSAASARRGRT